MTASKSITYMFFYLIQGVSTLTTESLDRLLQIAAREHRIVSHRQAKSKNYNQNHYNMTSRSPNRLF